MPLDTLVELSSEMVNSIFTENPHNRLRIAEIAEIDTKNGEGPFLAYVCGVSKGIPKQLFYGVNTVQHREDERFTYYAESILFDEITSYTLLSPVK
jgi:hypothetical protein